MKFIQKHFITQKDLIPIVEFTDDIQNLKELDTAFAKLRKGLKTSFISNVCFYIVFTLLLINTAYFATNITVLIPVIGFFVIVRIFNSHIANRYIYYAEELIFEKIIYNTSKNIDKSVFKDINPILNKLFSNIWRYFFRLERIIAESIILISLVTAISFSAENFGLKSFTLAIITIVLVIYIIIGSQWANLSKKIYKLHTNNKHPQKQDIIKRSIYPTIHNLFDSMILPLIIVLLSFIGSSLTVQIALFSTIIATFWTITNTLKQVSLTKVIIKELNSKIKTIEKKYIVNNKTHIKQCKICKPTKKELLQSKQNKSLVIKDFVPMIAKNKKVLTHVYNYEFKPGVYQINGENGVGKSTFLQSIISPAEYLTEYSKGKIAFRGKPFFDMHKTLKQHRNKYIYIGTQSNQVSINRIKIDLFKNYYYLYPFLQKMAKNKDKRHSEGQKAVTNICYAYQKILKNNGTKILVIDEVLSRIYEDPVLMLRSDIKDVIADIINIAPESIVLIVDHMTRVNRAKQLKLTKTSIFELKELKDTLTKAQTMKTPRPEERGRFFSRGESKL